MTLAIGLEKVHFRTHLEPGKDLKEAGSGPTVGTADHLEASTMLQMLAESVGAVEVDSIQPVMEKCEILVTGTVKAL